MPGGGGVPPGSSSAKLEEIPKTKVVVAIHRFKAIENRDLSLEKGAEYEVIDDSQEHWWKVKDENGSVGYIPSNYVKKKETTGLQQYEWYVAGMSRQRTESLLRKEDKDGCFVIRNSSRKGMYTLSLYTKSNRVPHCMHYHIKQNGRGEFFLSDKHCCASIPELVNYHKHNSGGLCSRLKVSPHQRAPPTAGFSPGNWEIDPSELILMEELGAGQFGVVRRGKLSRRNVAVKMMKEGTMSEDDFIEEAKVMTKLQHPNLVQLYGVCFKQRPIYIVTEYMRNGSLHSYLRSSTIKQLSPAVYLGMCIQVCEGMAYLEQRNYLHRDLAARNCLVGDEHEVKVADFGLARYVLDDEYTSASNGSKFPLRWTSPEVITHTRFSSKSDVWAFGVLMWEVFTCGRVPYGNILNGEVVTMIQHGKVLDRPKGCPTKIYEVMRVCWRWSPVERPSFCQLKETLHALASGVLPD